MSLGRTRRGGILSAAQAVSDSELKTHHCLESVDRVAGDAETTAFKRRARLQQALWREQRGLPIGTQPMRPSRGQPARPIGSRIAVDYARDSGANFLDNETLKAVRNRIANPEPHQTLYEDRLYADLLSSMPMCFNLFGPLNGDLEAANCAVHTWWPDTPGEVRAMRFEWSPGRRLRGEYLENRSAFDMAFELEMDDGSLGALGVETKYHEDCKREKVPNDDRRRRYLEVAEATGVFHEDAVSSILGTDHQQVWLDHLLALSMTQRRPQLWTWSKFVLVHPAKNPSYARASARYEALLKDTSTFQVSTIESLLAADVLPIDAAEAFAERYLW